jgi:hypothetical protein
MSSPRRYCGCKSPLKVVKLSSKSPKSPKSTKTVVWDPTQGRYIPVTNTKTGVVIEKLNSVKSPRVHHHRHHHHVEDEQGLD